jgi:hypothetical protein
MERTEFLELLTTTSAIELADRFLAAESVAAFADTAAYTRFKARVAECIEDTEQVILVGSGNWGYSLHPQKEFKSYDEKSDLDVAIVSEPQFVRTWEILREFHRRSWYLIPGEERQRLKRNGQNVYCGFVSPEWILDRRSTARYAFRRVLNRLSDHLVAYRPVKALYFRNHTEARDYYRRGFEWAQRAIAARRSKEEM